MIVAETIELFLLLKNNFLLQIIIIEQRLLEFVCSEKNYQI